jgi:HSP20 family protein
MTGLFRRESRQPARADMFDRFDRVFDEWMKALPFRRSAVFGRDWMAEDIIRVDEFLDDGTLVLRAELPGIDPEKDVELSVRDGMLCIEAQRREEEDTEEKGFVRRELRYGSLSRMLPLPEGVAETDITATYQDGILEIRVPAPQPAPATKIPIAKK